MSVRYYLGRSSQITLMAIQECLWFPNKQGQLFRTDLCTVCIKDLLKNFPTMKIWAGIPENNQVKLYMSMLGISIILHCGTLSNMPKCKCSLNIPLWEPNHPVPIWQFLEFCHCSCSANRQVYQPSCRLWNDRSHFQVHPESTSKCQQANRIVNFTWSSFIKF